MYHTEALQQITNVHGGLVAAALSAVMDATFDGLECMDNVRVAVADDADMVMEYEAAAFHGCCGSVDNEIVICGVKFLYGCNYGH